MSYRARHRRRPRAARFGPPAVIVAASLSVGAAQAATPQHEPHPVASVQHLAPLPAATPFAATPVTAPLDPPVVVAAGAHHAKKTAHQHPSASAPVVTLPDHLDVTASTIPLRVLAAYVNAAKIADKTDPTCKLQWQTLAGIGFIESDNARSGGSANPHWDGIANPPILGPVLNGKDGFAAVPDTDHGQLDGNTTWDRAVGPMQFIPSTWEEYAADGNHDGIENPEDIDDATLAAANYLCANGNKLNEPHHLIHAVYAYNHSYSYVKAVLTVAAHYENINPAKLGVNGLPKDPKHKHHKANSKAKHHKKSHHHAGASPSPSPSPSSTPTPSPSPTPTPTSSPTATPVAPSPTATPNGGHLPKR